MVNSVIFVSSKNNVLCATFKIFDIQNLINVSFPVQRANTA